MHILGVCLLLLQVSNAVPTEYNLKNTRQNGFREIYDIESQRDSLYSNVLPLRRSESHSNGLRRRKTTSSDLPLTAIQKNLLVDMKVDGQPFRMLVDTGSSDTWVAAKGFSCVDSNENPTSQTTCKIPSTLTQTSRAQTVPGVTLKQGYASGEFVIGPMVLKDLTIGGVVVQSSQMGAVDRVFWKGDGLNSGLLGLSGPITTTAQDASGKQALYNPVFQNMIQQNLTKPFFSIAIEIVQSGPAGFLSFGGLPPVSHEANFTTVPIVKKTSSFQGPLSSPQIVDYIVPVTAFTVNGKAMAGSKLEMVVDSGTFANLVPDDLANRINAMWKPAARFNNQQGLFQIDCAATMPDIGVTLKGKTFIMKSAAAIQKDGNTCFSAWAGSGSATDAKATFVLGDVFMKSVVSVFDLGTAEMHFAART